MSKPLTLALLAVLLCGLTLVSVALAQTSTNYNLTWHVVSSGGGKMDSATYAMEGTIGQVLAQRTESDNYALAAGYWYPLIHRYTVYLPLVLRAP
jgi:hypothetical protein